MKYLFILLSILFFLFSPVWGRAQVLSQTVRGTLTDSDSQLPLIGATLIIAGSNPLVGTTTDQNGTFRLTNIPTGRITLRVSYLGYESKAIPDIVVNSGKEVVLNLTLQESTEKLAEVVVKTHLETGKARNEMALISARSISSEETSRYAGGFNDPSLILSNFAGVANNPNGNNDIIVRGNSPKYVQWRLEGVQITNPNHFADQGAIGGGLSTLNNNILATSDFYTGAFAPEYGDVLSGVYDVKLRAGNNEKREAVLGVGILGTDLTVEGPFKKGYGGSYLVNYRYSTISLLTDLGLTGVKGSPKFQDAAFKILLPTKKAGAFSLFGLGGSSSAFLKEVKPEIAETPGDRSMLNGIREDLEKGSYLVNLGLTHTLPLTTSSYLHTTLSYSKEGIKDQVFESSIEKQYDGAGAYLNDSVLTTHPNYQSHLLKSTYRGGLTYHHKINARNTIQVGTQYTLVDYDYRQSHLREGSDHRVYVLDFQEKVGTIRSYISWKHRFNEAVTLVTGVQNMNVLLNHQSTLEPRVSLNWQLNPTNSFQVGYGKHSTMESAHNYFTQVESADGKLSEPNKNLGLLKAHHFVLGYEKRFTQSLVTKAEMYYQSLYQLPVENRANSTFATINEGPDFNYVGLVNKGTGKNYGIELTLERSFSHHYYFLLNGSLYSSTYRTLEGKTRNTPYNGHYLINLLAGKEFTNLGRKKNQVLAVNAKLFFSGGRNIIPLLRDAAGNLAVDPATNTFWDYEKAYETSLGDLAKLVLSVSYKWNKARTTNELFLNLDNVTNRQGKLTEYYDPSQPGSVGHTTQRGLVPNLMYRLYF
ncbi:carboxypeptidase-like regulatory domain-containing protein [Larkinella knui]|uniref:TonB-dependent receptor n=1 Tax=Larkinella knui TaxID=2025310 RepID=A0A3P1CKT4_9BACT|nr:carboxypeptidase-like regulatory domain-containing protein [Larkinella knui]RRB13895.1 TonB-dependent receptor [Larkinella knui]